MFHNVGTASEPLPAFEKPAPPVPLPNSQRPHTLRNPTPDPRRPRRLDATTVKLLKKFLMAPIEHHQNAVVCLELST